MRAFLSFLSLYRYDQKLFENFVVPPAVSKELVVNTILMEIGELEVIYPNYEFMRQALGFFSTKQLPVWTALEETLHYEYDPIENYNRVEHWTDNETGNRDNTTTGKSSETGSGNNSADIDSTSNISGNSTSTESVSAYNSSGFEPKSQTETESGERTTANQNSTGSSDYTNSSSNESTSAENENRYGVRDGYARGNIGVTTTQQMIKEQREVVEFSIVDKIVEDVKNRFCLGVW